MVELYDYYLLCYYKLYEGIMIKNGKSEKKIFYNEREWRFVPKLEKLQKLKIKYRLRRKDYDDERIKLSLHQKLEKKCMLYFEPKDVKYLFVEKDDEILYFRDEITKFKRKKYEEDDLTLLLSKFICTKDLIEDF